MTQIFTNNDKFLIKYILMRLQSKNMKKGPFKSSGKCDPEKQTLVPYYIPSQPA